MKRYQVTMDVDNVTQGIIVRAVDFEDAYVQAEQQVRHLDPDAINIFVLTAERI